MSNRDSSQVSLWFSSCQLSQWISNYLKSLQLQGKRISAIWECGRARGRGRSIGPLKCRLRIGSRTKRSDLSDCHAISNKRKVCTHTHMLGWNRFIRKSNGFLKWKLVPCLISLTCILPSSPVDSILEATLTVLPHMSYWGFCAPTTPATTGP